MIGKLYTCIVEYYNTKEHTTGMEKPSYFDYWGTEKQ